MGYFSRCSHSKLFRNVFQKVSQKKLSEEDSKQTLQSTSRFWFNFSRQPQQQQQQQQHLPFPTFSLSCSTPAPFSSVLCFAWWLKHSFTFSLHLKNCKKHQITASTNSRKPGSKLAFEISLLAECCEEPLLEIRSRCRQFESLCFR